MARRYFLIDQSMKGYSGHCYEYFRLLRDELISRGGEVHLVGHKMMDSFFQRQVRALPAMTYWCDERNVGQISGLDEEANADAIRLAHERAVFADLTLIDRNFGLSATDILVINTLRHWPLRGVVQWLESLPEDRRPGVSIILHFTSQPEPNYYDPSIRHYTEGFSAIATSPARSRIHLSADAETLIEEYGRMTSLKIELAPIPHAERKQRPRSTWAERKLRIGYAGEARYHKGFHLLPFVCESFLKSDLKDRVEFHVHAFCHDPRQDFYKKAMAHLDGLPNCVLYREEMPSDEYDEFMGSMDAFLVAYATANYHRQTSGIYAEAASLGVPVVVTRGTWMAREVRRLGGGLTCIVDDYFSLYEETDRLCREYPRLHAEAVTASKVWGEFNNPAVFIDMLDRWSATL